MFYAFCWRDEHPEINRMAVSQQTQVRPEASEAYLAYLFAFSLDSWWSPSPMIDDYIGDVEQDLQVDMDSGDEDQPKMEVTAA